MLSAGATYYGSGTGDRSVDTRAKQLPRIYREKAKNIDRTYCGSADGQVGPVQRRLDEFGDLGCFVVGQFGEGSHDLHQFLIKCANEKSKRLATSTGRPPSDFERSQILQHLRRRLSVCAITAQSSCLLCRLGHMSEGAQEASVRRNLAKSRDEFARQELRAHFEAGIRGRYMQDRVGHLHL